VRKYLLYTIESHIQNIFLNGKVCYMSSEILTYRGDRVVGDKKIQQCSVYLPTGAQCHNESVEGGTTCQAHGGCMQLAHANNLELRNFRLTKFRADIGRLANSDNIKSLRDEIGILRMILESLINRCGDVTELLINGAQIGDLVGKIEKLVASCHKIEGSTGELLDKQILIRFTDSVISVISTEVADAATVGRITDKLIEALKET